MSTVTDNKILLWAAQPKQARALACPYPELFYGGAKGGGKSDFLLMDFFTHQRDHGKHARGIIFRRSYNELEELITRSRELFQSSAEYSETKKTWTFKSGAYFKLRFLESDLDVGRYQGHQYCVAKGTLILMGDGSSKSIEQINIGDYVSTLTGQQRVTHTHKPVRKLCVQIMTPEGKQVNPIDHAILTVYGWQSYASMMGIYSKGFEDSLLRFLQLPSVNGLSVQLQHSQHQALQYPRLSKLYYYPYKLPIQLLGTEINQKHVLEGQEQPALSSQSHQGYTWGLSSVGGISCVLSEKEKVLDSQSYYPAYHHFHGGQLLCQLKNDQDGTPLQGGVALSYPVYCTQDVQGNTPLCNPADVLLYEHPYTGQALPLTEDISFSPFSISPFGYADVYDITVDNVNHYITSNTFLVNRNSWIGFDELTEWPTNFCYIYMFSCLRSSAGIPCYMRSTGNPGRIGHQWVKARFVDVAPEQIPYKDLLTGIIRVYIRALLEDNPALMLNDPQYEMRLKLLPPYLYEAFRHSNWDVIAGAAFQEIRREIHGIDVTNPPDRLLRCFDFEKMQPLPDIHVFRSYDWGYAKPFSIGYWFSDFDNRLYRWSEMYGCRGVNEGLQMPTREQGRRMKEFEVGHNIKPVISVAGSDIWSHPANMSEKSEKLPSDAEILESEGIYFDHDVSKDASKPGSRKAGKGQMHDRLRLDADGLPSIFIFSTCTHFWRTVPVLPVDKLNPDDIDTDAEDHIWDETYKMLLSRPFKSVVPLPELQPWTFAWYEKRMDERETYVRR